MKKYSKFLAIMLVFAMILPGIAQAAPVAGSTQVERVAGAGREETAIEASKIAYPAGATNVVLAGYAGEVDALTGTLLASEMKAPLLLTRSYKLSDTTKAEITRLGAKKVYILGGEKVVSKAVVTDLEAMNITVERIDGDNRYDTAVKAGVKSGTQTKKVFLAKGLGILADALAVGPASAKNDMPVLLTQTDMVPAETMKALKDWGVTHITLVGGTSAISAKVATQLKDYTVDRVEGSDREKTAVAIADKYFAGSKNVIVANGYVYADALVGGYLGALQNAPIVLVDTNVLKTSTEAHLKKADMAWILGGVNAVNATTANKVVAAVDDTAMELKVVSVSAINAKEVKVTFNNKVDKSTATTGANYTIGAFTPANSDVELQADAKTVIITLGTGNELTSTDTNYLVKVGVGVLDANGEALSEAYEALISLSDKVRPTITLSYPANDVARVTFSEPMNVANVSAIQAAMTITSPTGEAAVAPNTVVTAAFAPGDKSFDIDTSGFALNKNYSVSLVGLKDFAGNLMTPNPTILSVIRTTVDTVAPTVTSVEALDVNKIKVTFSEKLGTLGTVNGEPTILAGATTVDSTGLVYTITTGVNATNASPALSGVVPVTIAGFKDMSGNLGTTFTKTLNFVADNTDPVYVSSEVKQVGSDQYLFIKYNENVTLGSATTALTGTYVDSNSITKPMNPIAVAGNASQALDFGQTTTDTIKVKINSLAAGTYTVATDANLVDDLAGNTAASKTINFTVGSVVDPSIPVATVTSPVQATEDKVEVTFTVPVTASTALNLANYTVEGQQVFKKAIFKGDTQTVELTLMPGVITQTGDRTMVVKNVATSAGKIMKTLTVVEKFQKKCKAST